ncbi:transposase [Zobellella taiwanensis]
MDQDYYHQIAQHGGYYLVRGKLTLNPTIVEARNGQGRLLPKLAGKKLKDVTRRDNRSDVLDMIVRSSKLRYRLVRRWFAPEKRFILWMTNLPRDEFNSTDIMLLYRSRWQVELLFKELKSHTNLRKFNTEQKAIVEGLIWSSLLTLILKRL